MATLVFGSIGTALAGPLGGAIGALVGRQTDAGLFGAPGRQGPRLRELDVSLSTYGQPIPRIHGRMRTAGAVIWATELEEHAESRGAGKGLPAITTYSYTANLAVALSSRPIQRIGRVWADGRLLRGAAGDLKVGGTIRIHSGGEDQPVDPLIAAAQGAGQCPAFRGLAYVVFEGLELATYGNRVPALTFEVIAEEAASLADVLIDSLEGCTVLDDGTTLAGLVVEDNLAASLAQLQPVMRIAIDAAGADILVRVGQEDEALVLEEPAASVADDAFAGATGASHRRAPPEAQPTPVLRYFDVDRDYQPGTQHAVGRAGIGQPDVVELPAALQAAQARTLVESLRRRRDRARDRVAWRTCALDPAVGPGAHVRLPQRVGTWQVESWEWREMGVEIELTRVDATPMVQASGQAQDTFPAPADRPANRTQLVAFELPWDGASGAPDRAHTVVAAGADGPEWSGAALFVDQSDGQLRPLGPASRNRATVGIAVDALMPANPLLLDRHSRLTVTLASSDQALDTVNLSALGHGANLALVGEELVQFAHAEPLGGGTWRLSHFLRGCGGTETAVGRHRAGLPFALVDGALTTLDPGALGSTIAGGAATILASGRGDQEPVTAPLLLSGLGQRPLAPVHGRSARSEGALHLAWTRRARGGWSWSDGVDVPLAEEAERYIVSFHRPDPASDQPASDQIRAWTVAAAALQLTVEEVAQLAALAPTGWFQVRQQGTRALSLPLTLARLG